MFKKAIVVLFAAITVAIAVPAHAASTTIKVHISVSGGQPFPYVANPPVIILKQFQLTPEFAWDGAWYTIGEYQCGVQRAPSNVVPVSQPPGSTQPGVIVVGPPTPSQGCVDGFGQAAISKDRTGVDLTIDEEYLVKVNMDGYRQGVVAWIYGRAGDVDVYVDLWPKDLNTYVAMWVEGKTTVVWTAVYNFGATRRTVTLGTEAIYPSPTSQEVRVPGFQSNGFTLEPYGDYQEIIERWLDPSFTMGSVYGELNCHRGQAGSVDPASGLVEISEDTTCLPNYQIYTPTPQAALTPEQAPVPPVE